jgi:hypothetical protein
LAFLTCIAHGIVHGRQAEAIALGAWWSLVAFALLGSIVGWIAQRVVEDSVHALVARQLAALKTPEKTNGTSSSSKEKPPAHVG